jgi:hypothetical protein
MSLRYALFKNTLKPGSGELFARVLPVEPVEFSEIMRMLTRRGLSITDTEAESVINELVHTINEVLDSGRGVLTPLANFQLSIKGKFYHPDEVFDPSKHKVHVVCTKGRKIKIDYNTLKTEKLKPETASPQIDKFIDYASQTENNLLTPGGTAEINGDMLKVDTDDVNQGLFFIASDSSETRVTNYMHNRPSMLIFMVPAGLAPGVNELEVRTKVNASTLIDRKRFSEKLTVV